eukprot:m.28495 g.28495  ORF g.28495 m.28495 type:complete len:360 (+) comp9044_c0_seq2:131-1210(+)
MEQQFVLHEICQDQWLVPQHYDVVGELGHGAYGAVCSVNDTRTQTAYAMKKLHHPFRQKHIARRALREINLLRFADHPNVISLKDVFFSQQEASPTMDLYLVTELMTTDLRHILESQQVSIEHTRYFLYQMLKALKYLHSAGIVHRDIKPENITVNENCDLKLVDFGLARAPRPGDQTPYVQTRYYRAPEVLLDWGFYGPAVDMWSVGCVFAECISGCILFPGVTYDAHLKCIIQLRGKPTPELLARMKGEAAIKFATELPDALPTSLADMFPGTPEQALELLDAMLLYDVDQRVSAAGALAHPFFSEWHNPEHEPESQFQFDDSFEDLDMSIEELQGLIIDCITQYQQQQLEQAEVVE